MSRISDLSHDSDSFLFFTKQRFLQIPKEVRRKIWSLFFKTFYINSFFFLQKGSIKQAIYWQTLYITFFFVLGIWNPKHPQPNLDYWKKIVYKFGRFSQSSLDTSKIPFLDIHTIMIHLLIDELQDDDFF